MQRSPHEWWRRELDGRFSSPPGSEGASLDSFARTRVHDGRSMGGRRVLGLRGCAIKAGVRRSAYVFWERIHPGFGEYRCRARGRGFGTKFGAMHWH
jgi:hypothetical protein